MGDQQVSVGRAVHFTEDGETCLAATVAAVNDDGTINIGWLSEWGGNRQAQGVVEGDGAHQWHWPERV